ncbi:MAG: hypothetical protein ACI9EM_000647 [Candidatus Thalassarchaeaceae archaeon]|jgi:hypothetical protein|tara:strand:- start:1839 stop:2648 length:810 start_codon:yes stop_codon:yes gene_type:complete
MIARPGNMEIPALSWDAVTYDDPDGGKIIFWPHLPCIMMPSTMRLRKWDGLALLYSSDDIAILKKEDELEIQNPGINVQAVLASGSGMGLLLKDIQILDVDGPKIPDPEPTRLIHHAENSGERPIYSIIPEINDEKWEEWYINCADNQVKIIHLLGTLTKSRRYAKNRLRATSKVQRGKNIDSDLGAASASCASWWMEDNRGLTKELIKQRDGRFASRIRGALADLRNRRVDESSGSEPSLLVPVHQAHLGLLVDEINNCIEIEEIRGE